MGRQFLPCFSVVKFEHEFVVRKVKLGKYEENHSNGHESQILDPFFSTVRDYFKTNLKHIFELDRVIRFTANMIFGTFFLNR